MDILELARRVKRGVRLLDKKVPNWRTVMRKHKEQFDFVRGDHCVLGTLEHFSGRMRVLVAKKRAERSVFDHSFDRAMTALGIPVGGAYRNGFDSQATDDTRSGDMHSLSALWRVEFEK